MDKPAMRMSEEDNPADGVLSAGGGTGDEVRTRPRTPSALRVWIVPLVLAVVGFLLIHPFDGPWSDGAARLAARLSGDARRELMAWQQYGQGVFVVVLGLVILLQDPKRRRRLLDLILLVALAKLAAQAGKMLIGRPRPRPEFDDPSTFLGPWGEYPILVRGEARLVHAWDTAAGATTDLWSMPSSHTLFAAAVSVFIAALCPRLRWVVAGLTVVVAVGRVLFDAHWPTDVVIGAAAGYVIGAAVTWNYAGVRLVDWAWRTFVNRDAQPALGRVLAVERSRRL